MIRRVSITHSLLLHISIAIYIDMDMSVYCQRRTQLDNMSIYMHTTRQTPRHFVAPFSLPVSLLPSLMWGQFFHVLEGMHAKAHVGKT